MKGFIKILETVIACIILLTSLTFFFTLTQKSDVWTENVIQQRSLDTIIIVSSDPSPADADNSYISSAIKSFDSSQDSTRTNLLLLHDKIKKALPTNIDYALIVEGIPKPVINIKCNCNGLDVGSLLDSVEELAYKGRQIKFAVSDNIPDDEADVVVYTDYTDIPGNKDSINRLLADGKSVFLIDDITGDVVKPEELDILREILALEKDVSPGIAPSGNSVFTNNINNINVYTIKKYLDSIKKSDCSDFALTGDTEGTARINTFLVTPNTALKTTGNEFSRLVVSANGAGRTAWMATPKEGYLNRLQGGCEKNLTKSVVMWLASSKFYLTDQYLSERSPPQPSARRLLPIQSISYNIMFTTGTKDNIEVATVRLLTWRVFF